VCVVWSVEGSRHRCWIAHCHRPSSSVCRLHGAFLVSTFISAHPKAVHLQASVAEPGPSPPAVHDNRSSATETQASRPHPYRDGAASLRAVVRRCQRKRSGARYVDIHGPSDQGAVVACRHVLAASGRRQRPRRRRARSPAAIRVHRRLADSGLHRRSTTVRAVCHRPVPRPDDVRVRRATGSEEVARRTRPRAAAGALDRRDAGDVPAVVARRMLRRPRLRLQDSHSGDGARRCREGWTARRRIVEVERRLRLFQDNISVSLSDCRCLYTVDVV